MSFPVEIYKALADEQRLKILEFLASGDPSCCSGPYEGICACDVQEGIGLAQATVSHHMKILVQARLVRSEKRGRWVYYSLDPEGLEAVRAHLGGLFAVAARAAEGSRLSIA